MILSATDWERAARALCRAQHFDNTDAPVIVKMKQYPVWQTRIPQVRAVVEALRDSDGSPEGGDAKQGSVEDDSAGPQDIAQGVTP